MKGHRGKKTSISSNGSFYIQHFQRNWFSLILQTIIIVGSGLFVMYGTVGKLEAKFEMLTKQVDKVEKLVLDHMLLQTRPR